MNNSPISWSDFDKIEMRVGTIEQAEVFEKAHKPAYQLLINFGDLGMKKSSAQLTKNYQASELIGKQIVAVVNFPPKQIANFMSECLVLGAVDGEFVTLLSPTSPIKNGLRIA